MNPVRTTTTCAICHERINPHGKGSLLADCMHAFHINELFEWLKRTRKSVELYCPLCERKVTQVKPTLDHSQEVQLAENFWPMIQKAIDAATEVKTPFLLRPFAHLINTPEVKLEQIQKLEVPVPVKEVLASILLQDQINEENFAVEVVD